eukprot:TRINITY_DN3982_c1_g1_i1.p1 TRINITY_DN3982_c1_g1~~TRINITY_DN3982_c1_g1_i1.p1  ORF type:complete len:695 (-),score=215.36 TRINITY_DN3982_c1_g1_i1:193-2277(-)
MFKLILLAAFFAVCLAEMPPMPGLFTANGVDGGLFGRGYDPITQTPRLPIVDFTYDGLMDDNKWTDPESGMTFHKPDQCDIQNLPMEKIHKESTMYQHYHDYQTSSWHKHHFGFDVGVASFSESEVAKFMKEVTKGSQHVVVMSDRQLTTFHMTLWSPDILQYMMEPGQNQAGTFFAQQRTLLPKSRSTESEKRAYREFLETFGTHYVDGAKFGGNMRYMCVVNKSFVTKHGSSYTDKQVGFSFTYYDITLGFSAGSTKIKDNITEEFKQNSQMVLIANGGDPAFVDTDHYSKWLGSVHYNPAPIEPTYRTIADLVEDPTIAANIKAATKEYLNQKPQYTPSVCATPPGHMVSTKPASNGAELMESLYSGSRVIQDAAFANDYCDPNLVIPGADSGGQLGKSFDYKSGKTMFSVVPQSCNEGKKWYDEEHNKWWSIPDGVTFIDTPSACFEEQQHSIRNMSSLTNTIAHNYGVSVGVTVKAVTVGVGFSIQKGKTTSELKKFALNRDEVDRTFRTYRLQSGGSTPTLNPQFKRAVDMMLTKTYDAKKYGQFIKYFGTHYIAQSDFGGHCKFTSTYQSSMHQRHTDKFMSEQVSLSLSIAMTHIGIGVDLGLGITKHKGKVDADFAKNSHTDYKCDGGNLDDLKAGNYDAWSKSIHLNPAAIPNSLKLKPLTDLVFDEDKKNNLRRAIDEYLSHP